MADMNSPMMEDTKANPCRGTDPMTEPQNKNRKRHEIDTTPLKPEPKSKRN